MQPDVEPPPHPAPRAAVPATVSITERADVPELTAEPRLKSPMNRSCMVTEACGHREVLKCLSNVLRMSGTHALRDDSNLRCPLDALVS